MGRYKEASKLVFEIFFRFTPLVEPISIDEAFLDVTGSRRLFGHPVEIAKKIKRLVRLETGLTVSAGLAPSKFIAKIASDLDKPDGLTVVPSDRIKAFLDPLPIEKMWGVGKETRKALIRLNLHTFKDLRQASVNVLEKKLGKYGLKMHQLAMGLDERDVVPHHEAKSIGHELTFSSDILDRDEAKKELLSLANRVARRMRQHGLTGRTVTLKVKYIDFVQVTRAVTLPKSTDDGPEIYATACLLSNKTSLGKRPVRLLGISLSQLNHAGADGQLSLFHRGVDDQKRKDLHAALDSLYDKFGEKSVRPGTLIHREKGEKEAPSSETKKETDERAEEGMNLTNGDSPLF
jgi:DNA polymerase-4